MLSNNPVDSFGWAGNYYFAKNKLLDHITFGHGKSEIEPWDLKEILYYDIEKDDIEDMN